MNEAIALGQVNGRPHTHTDKVVVLDSQNAADWALFPRFVARCTAFAETLLGFNKLQIANFEQDLKNRWATHNGALFIAVLDGTGTMVGHVCGWINVDYGQPYLFNFQADMDEGYDLRPIVDDVFYAHVEYIGWANAMYEKGGQPVRVNKVRTQTMRNADAIIRYLRMKGIHGVIERTVIGWDV